ncbi:MAG TPA: RNA polymerase sigma factor [Solirubrobacteraceae bacterium]
MSGAQWPSERIVRAAQQGDQQAISSLVSSSHPHVQRFAHTLCATPDDAEEAAQEALVILYRKIGTLRVAAALGSWMFEIVRRECIRRTRFTIHAVALSAPADPPSAEEVALRGIEIERIIRCVAGLPDDLRTVLVMRDLQGLSGAETARALGLKKAAMKSRLHRARQVVRTELSSRPYERSPAPR